MARATRSELKAARSSSEPPPRARTMRSACPARPRALASAMPDSISATARSPCTSGWDEDHIQAGVAAVDNVEEVANDGSGGRGDNGYGAGKRRQRALALLVEESLGFTESRSRGAVQRPVLQAAGADRLHCLSHQLKLAALLVDAHFAAHAKMQAVLGAEAEKHGLAAEEDDGQLRFGVLEREVESDLDDAGAQAILISRLPLQTSPNSASTSSRAQTATS